MLGAIADDFTGATDLATNLVTRGFKTTVTIGVPGIDFDTKVDADATVVALKTRTAPVSEAIADSRRALSWLRGLGATKIYDKYCSTFDSTATGNIGPIAEALMNDLGVDTSIVVPSFPDNERTVYQGHLFVGDQLLSNSSMRNHPLTPMTESNLTRLLSSQTSLPVHLIPLTDVRSSIETIRAHFGRDGLHILDAITTADLQTIASATEDFPLVTGGSGLALGMTGPRRSETARAIDNPYGLPSSTRRQRITNYPTSSSARSYRPATFQGRDRTTPRSATGDTDPHTRLGTPVLGRRTDATSTRVLRRQFRRRSQGGRDQPQSCSTT